MGLWDENDDFLAHYGTPRHSGRYPWGSGKKPQRSKDLLGRADELKKKGLTEREIADELGLSSTTELRAMRKIAKNNLRAHEIAFAQKLRDKGMSNVAIGKRLGIGESQVRSLLSEGYKTKNDTLNNTAEILKESLKKNKYLDVGVGVSKYMGVSDTTLKTACKMLEQEGYELKDFHVRQLTTGNETTVKVLCPEGTTARELHEHIDQISMPGGYTVDGGSEINYIHRPKMVDHNRVAVRYATDDEDSGALKDGVIELRRGVKDLDMGNSRYAQVRIALDNGMYLKGMAVYSDDIPDGADILFNSNKAAGTPLEKVFKPQKDDPDHPFGSSIDRQNDWRDEKGDVHEGALNIVREEGAWGEWKKSIASQVLSKQPVELAKKQLNLAANETQEEFEEIMSLTNPVIKQKLLEDFAGQCDSAAVELKAAAFPRQASHVILPVNSLKDNEIYAPRYVDGEEVVLIRYPHGGKFEMPRLKVNNKNQEARNMMGSDATDAVGINSNVAQILSGADFDGDSVLVIPTKGVGIQNMKPLEALKGFDPKASYPDPHKLDPSLPHCKLMSEKTRDMEMGKITNLITDMTLRDAPVDELARAVRHSMVVIDAYKHELDYTRSYEDNAIAELKVKYQGGTLARPGGAGTLISKASSQYDVPVRKEGMIDPVTKKRIFIDPDTGEKLYTYTGEKKYKVVKNPDGSKDFVLTDKPKTQQSTKMYEAKDAFELSSGHPMETVYATYANKMKALGNQARKESLNVGKQEYSPSAYQTYKAEVDSLNAKLNIAIKNAPRERKAQMLANSVVKAKMADHPEYKEDKDALTKLKTQELNKARAQVGASKDYIKITEREWEAIQAGAVTTNKLTQIINNADTDVVRKLATPRAQTTMTPAKIASAKAMLNAGFTIAEVAERYGVSSSTISHLRGDE